MASHPDPRPVADAPGDYWTQTRRPIVCLAFFLPLLAAYEIGAILAAGHGHEPIRNGADGWLRELLKYIGLNAAWILPALVVFGMLYWNVLTRRGWRFSLDTLPGMAGESLLFAIILIAVGQLIDFLTHAFGGPLVMQAGDAGGLSRALAFVGAGIYEELLFRLYLLSGLCEFFRVARLGPRWSLVLAVISSSLGFSLAHYMGTGEPVEPFGFAFRALAGLGFAGLYIYRGIGIAIGTHAAYDLLAGLLLTG